MITTYSAEIYLHYLLHSSEGKVMIFESYFKVLAVCHPLVWLKSACIDKIITKKKALAKWCKPNMGGELLKSPSANVTFEDYLLFPIKTYNRELCGLFGKCEQTSIYSVSPLDDIVEKIFAANPLFFSGKQSFLLKIKTLDVTCLNKVTLCEYRFKTKLR